jgi:ABC-type nickel/cobalt efflux system permease component RcnA
MTLRLPGRMTNRCVIGIAAAVAILCIMGALDAAMAQGGPFGVGRPSAPAASAFGGFSGWILAKQAEFYRALSGMIRAAKSDGSAVWTLLGLSFAYGIFHAAGPGHGKAVISSYVVANEETWTRGVTLSFASAMLQALTAIAIVSIAAVLLGATAKAMGDTVRWIETASYALIAAFGARLTWVKGRGFLRALAAHRAQEHSDPHRHHDHHHDSHGAHAHHHGHDHDHDDHSGHSHGPEPQDLAGPGGWKRGLTAIVAVGLRPCSGAIIVLVFALAQGLFWAGVASTFVMGLGTAITVASIATLAVVGKGLALRLAAHKAGYGSLALRGIEVAAAVLVLVFGLALLAGYMASERMVGV